MRTKAGFVRCVAGVVLLAGIGYGCGGKADIDTEPVVRPVKTIVAGGFMTGEFRFPATVDAGEKALMSFRVSGRLIELPVKEGQTVKKGDLLARLDPTDFVIALDEAKARYSRAQSDFVRYQRLYERNAVPLSDLELRRSMRDVSKAKMDEAEKNLGYTRLTAPFDGQIGRRYVENFMDVTAQQEIVDVNDVTNVEIVINVAENFIKQISAGYRADAFGVFEVAPGQRFPLTLKEISNRADPQTQTFKVTYLMAQPQGFTLLPGMTATAVVTISQTGDVIEPETISVPAIAVMGDERGAGFVWIVAEGDMTVHKRTVTIGAMSGSDEVTVLEGLAGGETIVVAGMSKLQEGMKVYIWKPEDY